MKQKFPFFRQLGVLIKRGFNIFINNKKNLTMSILLPLITILIVGFIAGPDMFTVKPEDSNSINDSYPVLNWERVVQLEEDEDDPDKLVEIESDEVILKKWDGDSTEYPETATKIDGENYFLITNADQLAFLSKAASSDYDSVRDYLTYNYILQADIDLKSHNFSPIGTKDYPFTGTFDGNGHIIKNLKIDTSDDNAGFFGYVRSNEKASEKVTLEGNDLVFYHNGIIKNFQIKNPDIKTRGTNCAVIAGCIDGTARVTSVSAKGGKIVSEKGTVGAIVGKSVSPDTEVYVCYSTTQIKAKKACVGGLVGDLGSSRLSGAYSTSKIIYNGKADKDNNYGAVVGCCDDYEKQIKNVYYDSKLMEKNDKSYKAVNNADHENYAVGIETDDLYNYASFLVPFKGIETAYDIVHPDEDEEEKDDDYDAEEDDELDNIYGFKKDDQLAEFNSTQIGLFMLACIAVFIGICNSVNEICKERNILKREYMTNLNLGSYVLSKVVVQTVVCAVQMVIVLFVFSLFIKDKLLPETGVIFSSVWIEYYISLFLIALASDLIALVVSSVVKSTVLANLFIPIILIIQTVFSGVLFEMDGFMDVLANCTVNKLGISALAATSKLNDAQAAFLIQNPTLQLQMGSEMSTVQSMYDSTVSNILMLWGGLFATIVICIVLCRVLLIMVKNDKR